MTALHVRSLHAGFVDGDNILRQLEFSLAPGTIGCLLGASGCGKTTALRAIAGFLRPRSGSISIAGTTVFDVAHWVAPEERGVGVVFQDYALFPHLSAAQNVAFGLRHQNKALCEQTVEQMLALVGLTEAAQRYPHQLSGGQQQRVALARALAPQPRLLLLDEPFSNLDPDMRERLAQDVRAILKRTGTTSLLVTHDQYEAFALADEVGVMQNGTIDQWDTAYNLYHRPNTAKVADFVGLGVFLPGTLRSAPNGDYVEMEFGRLPLKPGPDSTQARDCADSRGELTVLMRPDDVIHDDESPFKAQVMRRAFRGAQFLYTVRLESGRELLALIPSHHDHQIGEFIGLRFDADHVITFSANTVNSSS
jgi:iron(III) transport system ATP-binding protein